MARAQPLLTPVLSATITNPNPDMLDYFGFAVAEAATDKLVVGARKDNTTGTELAGIAYVFNTDGALLTTITNPTPAELDYFGFALAGVGSGHVLIGDIQDDTAADDAGAVYLFTTEGALAATLLSPAPVEGQHFGFSIASLGPDRAIIGTLPFGPGSAYLINTNGTLLQSFTNPVPSVFDDFGSDVAVAGAGLLLIGAQRDDQGALDTGSAYLFSTNGTLITTFTNPTPQPGDRFGNAVAGVGPDKVIIGAMSDNTGAADAGAAYLFATNGALVHTFTNPAPSTGDSFGHAVAAFGSDKVVITALFNDTGASNAGIAYVFSTNGSLLATITNPAPIADDRFGNAVAVMSESRIAVGVSQNDDGARDSGAVHLFELKPPMPRISIEALPGGDVRLSWPLSASGFILEAAESLASPPASHAWTQVPFPYQTNAAEVSRTVTPDGSRFYRLRQ